MKKLLLILVFCVFFCSCQQKYDILSYQENDILANCTVNEKYNVNIVKKDGALRLDVLSPDTLKGISFEIRGDKAYAIKDADTRFSIQSISKVFALAMTLPTNIFA